MLVGDLLVFHRESKAISIRQAALWTVLWCGLALAFNGLIWYFYGADNAVLFLTGYLVEWSLSMDNVFVFAVIFTFFGVPMKYQYRVLFWGILGAIVLRLTFIVVGKELIDAFHWVLLIFGLFLVYTGMKLALVGDTDPHPDKNIILRIARRLFPVAKENHGEKFFVIENGRRCITPLFLVLLVIESTDVMFAVDSVPAIFSITRDEFLVFTSNIFAILGLRALYFLLLGAMNKFRYLHYGLSAVLTFVGLKMITEYGLENWAAFKEVFVTYLWKVEGHKPVSPLASLLTIITLLGLAVLASFLANRRDARAARIAPPEPGDATSEGVLAATGDSVASEKDV
jgi:tellurite resistance protein TerC